MVIWRCTTSGEFTVRSAYHMEKEKQELKQGEVQKPRDVVESKRKLGTPVKMFLWWGYNDLLTTKANLQKRSIVKDSLCIFCNLEIESTLHVLWSCPSPSDVWGA